VTLLRRRLSVGSVLLAWLLATGVQWDVVQAFAWVKMFAANTRTLPLGQAIERTFSPAGRCHLCRAVSTAKKQHATSTAPREKSEGKILLLPPPASGLVITLPRFETWPPTDVGFASADRAAPPLPPPRA
jgi:hypothetical protein